MSDDTKTKDARSRNHKLGIKLATVVVVMLGFSYLLVPLYDVICDITGLNGRTGVVSAAAQQEQVEQATDDRLVTVEFLVHSTSDGLWRFEPETSSMRVQPGKHYSINYVATNKQDVSAVAQAVPSVSPVAAAVHFNKVECFCFTEQAFAPNESRKMPVTFVVNKSLPGKVKIMSLAYTFYDITDAHASDQKG